MTQRPEQRKDRKQGKWKKKANEYKNYKLR